MKQLNQVIEWHKAFNIPILKSGEIPQPGRYELRVKLIKEEIKELIETIEENNIKHICKEMADVEYVAFGTILEMGWDFTDQACFAYYSTQKAVTILKLILESDEPIDNEDILDLLYLLRAYRNSQGMSRIWDDVFSEVHRSNMSKLGNDGKPVYREDGKVLKGPNFAPADLSFLSKNN